MHIPGIYKAGVAVEASRQQAWLTATWTLPSSTEPLLPEHAYHMPGITKAGVAVDASEAHKLSCACLPV